MSGDRWEREREDDEMQDYRDRRAIMSKFADEIYGYAWNLLDPHDRDIREYPLEKKMEMMQRYRHEFGLDHLGIDYIDEIKVRDFFYECSVEFLERPERPGFGSRRARKVHEGRIEKFLAEIEVFSLDFLRGNRKFSERSDEEKMAFFWMWNERVGLANIGILVPDEERFFEEVIDFLNGRKKVFTW